MGLGDSLEWASQLAAQAFERLAKERMPPSPENYTLWYVYYSGENPDLTRTVDVIIREEGKISPSKFEDLFRRFFSFDAEAQVVREAGERTQSALTRVLDMLSAAGADAGRYKDALSEFRIGLDEPVTIDQMRVMIGEIAAETRVIADEHAKLQGHLSETSKQLAAMRARLQTARREAMTDGLTGINNRKAFDETLAVAAQDAVHQNEPMCLLMVDIDHFKKFNDTHGHLVGDHVLKLVARVLTECIKGRDTAARYGGEEFGIILPQTSLTNAVVVANHIRTTVGSRQIINRARNENFGNITLSIGAAQYRQGEPPADLVQRADAALYSAKRTGRNRVCAESAETDRPAS